MRLNWHEIAAMQPAASHPSAEKPAAFAVGEASVPALFVAIVLIVLPSRCVVCRVLRPRGTELFVGQFNRICRNPIFASTPPRNHRKGNQKCVGGIRSRHTVRAITYVAQRLGFKDVLRRAR